MEWTQDFCLSCDRQTTNGAYCSQSCRLMDIERAGSDSPTILMAAVAAPVSRTILTSTYSSAGLNAGSGFYLPPPIDFAACQPSSGHSKTTMSTRTAPTSPTIYTSLSKFQTSNSQHSSTKDSAAYPSAYPRARSPMFSPLLETSNGKMNGLSGNVSERHLTPSSSGISLSSMKSVSSCQSLSDQARAQLQIYHSSFDSTRDLKRRATLG